MAKTSRDADQVAARAAEQVEAVLSHVKRNEIAEALAIQLNNDARDQLAVAVVWAKIKGQLVIAALLALIIDADDLVERVFESLNGHQRQTVTQVWLAAVA